MAEKLNYMSGSVPASYDYINTYNHAFRPGTVHCQDTALVWYFERYLIQKIISVYEFSGIPENWDEDYFRYALFVTGHCEVLNTRTFGIIPQRGTLGGYNVYYRPKYSVIANPLLKGSIRAEIGLDCSCIRMQPDYFGAWDLVSYYADLFGLCAEAMAVSLVNSKFAYVFGSDNKAQAESFKKMYDQIASGQPASFVDKNLFDEEGNPKWILFTQNLKQNYIANDIANTMINLDSQFNTMVGIPNVNINKSSGVSDQEVNANNTQTKTLAEIWLKEIRKGLEQTNEMFGLNLSVRLRFEEDMMEGGEQDEAVSAGDL